MKKFISIVLVIMMVMSLFAMSAVSSSALPFPVKVTVGGTNYYAKVGDVLTYNVYMNVNDVTKDLIFDDESSQGYIENIQSKVTYNSATLELVDYDKNTSFPILKNGLVANSLDGVIEFNGSNISWGYNFSTNKSVLFTAKFKVIGTAATKIDTIKNTYVMCGLTGGATQKIINKGVIPDGLYYKETLDGGCMPSPVLVSATNTETGPKITWKKVSGAKYYQIFYKVGSGSWKKVTKAKTGTSYILTSAKNKTKYTFTVAVCDKNRNLLSNDDTKGKAVTYYTAPKLGKVTRYGGSSSGKVKVTWTKVSGAKKYQVYRKVGSGKWSKIGTSTGSYIISTKLKKGKKYTFTVRCMDKKGNLISSYRSKGIYIKY